jgi:CHAD domain-containing protein
VLPAKGRKSFVSQLKALQDNLGQHQDAEVQVAELRALAHDLSDRSEIVTDALLATGQLIDHLERVRQRERDAFTERFAAYDTAANRKLLDAP